MNRYHCKVGKTDGKITWVTISARDEKQVHLKLLEKDYYIFDIEQEQRSFVSDLWKKIVPYRVSMKTLINFTRQLLTLQKAGLTITDTFDSLAKQSDDSEFKRIINDIKGKMEQGMALSSAMVFHENVFSPLYTQSIYAGEKSGTLEEVLRKLIVFLEKRRAIQQQLVGAMAYPVVLLVVLTGVLSYLFISVIPKFVDIFDAAGATLPFITRVVMGSAQWFKDNVLLLILIVIAITYEFKNWTQTELGRFRWHSFLMKIPLFGPLVKKSCLQQFAGTLSTLTGAGISLLTGLDIVRGTLPNVVFMSKIGQVEKNLLGGMSFSDSLRETGEFPEIITRMVSVGEKSGDLPDMLREVSEFYEEDIDVYTTLLSSLLEPLLLLFFGGIILIVFLAVFIPVLQLSANAGG